MLPMPAGAPVAYPEIVVGGKTFQILWGPAARYQLSRFGFRIGEATPLLAYAAAMLGTVKDGVWRSARLTDPMDLAEMMLPGEIEGAYDVPCATAIKNTVPGIEVTTAATPAQAEAA